MDTYTSGLTVSIFSGILLLCVVVPPAFYYVVTQKGAASDLKNQNENHQEVITLLNEIKYGHSQQIIDLFSGGNNLYNNIDDIVKVVKILEQKQDSSESIINTRLNFLETQINRVGESNTHYQDRQHHFLYNIEQQTREHLSNTDCTVEEIKTMVDSLQNAPQGSLLYRIGSVLVDAIPQ